MCACIGCHPDGLAESTAMSALCGVGAIRREPDRRRLMGKVIPLPHVVQTVIKRDEVIVKLWCSNGHNASLTYPAQPAVTRSELARWAKAQAPRDHAEQCGG